MPFNFKRSYDFNAAQQESSSGMSDTFGRHFKKQTARAKEKLLEGLGKAKATQDDVFDQHASNLSKQSKACERLQRDLKNYGFNLKAMIQAQKTLRETIRDLYEADWPDREHVCAITQSLDLQWDDYEKIINEQLIGSVNNYMSQFVDLKAKIAKRGRKLVDYDVARNNYSTVKASSKKGNEDPKVIKALQDLQHAETMYRDMNKELVDTLPATYDSRITFFVDTLQTLFNAECTNHNECGRYNKSLVNQLDSLGNSFDRLRVPRPEQESPTSWNDSRSQSQRASLASSGSGVAPSAPSRPSLSGKTSPPVSPRVSLPTVEQPSSEVAEEETIRNQVYPRLNAKPNSASKKDDRNQLDVKANNTTAKRESPNPFDTEDSVEKKDKAKSKDSDDADASSNNPFDEPDQQQQHKASDTRKVLYKVRATHHYSAEDTDELTFDAGEIIAVLESREDDLLDDGWLLGIKQSDGIQGVFPANFTKQI